MKNHIKLYDVATGALLATLDVPVTTYPMMMAYSPDGRHLAFNVDNTVKLLELATLLGGGDAVELPRLWEQLGSADVAAAYRAQWQMVRAGKDAVTFLEAKLRPVEAVESARLERLIKELGSARYAVRANAARELGEIGQAAGPALRLALVKQPTLEARRRIEAMLVQTDLRPERAIEVLEWIGDAAARKHLQLLAGGITEAPLTQSAKGAIDRQRSAPSSSDGK